MFAAQAAYHMPMLLAVVVFRIILPVSQPALFTQLVKRVTPLFAQVMQEAAALVTSSTVAYAFFQHDLPLCGTHVPVV